MGSPAQQEEEGAEGDVQQTTEGVTHPHHMADAITPSPNLLQQETRIPDATASVTYKPRPLFSLSQHIQHALEVARQSRASVDSTATEAQGGPDAMAHQQHAPPPTTPQQSIPPNIAPVAPAAPALAVPESRAPAAAPGTPAERASTESHDGDSRVLKRKEERLPSSDAAQKRARLDSTTTGAAAL
jgi:hypothetical protein